MSTKPLPSNPYKTKPHFLLLDGLRGVAAVGIVIFHFMEIVYPDPTSNFIGHGFLAVDFFFCLSGFVISYAYDDRMEKIGTAAFFKARLLRLHPLVVLGSVLGLIALLLDPFRSPAETYSVGTLALLFVGSVLLIPLPILPERFFNLFSLNAPAWTLFWEYVANVLYALFLHRISRPLLMGLVVVSAVVLGLVSYRAGNLMGGWSKENFWDGGARLAYSFLAGLLVYRSNWLLKTRLGFLSLSVLLLAALTMPFFQWNGLAEWLVVLLYFPLLVALGAGASLRPKLRKVCELLGNLSYPLYMTHYAVMWLFAHYYNQYKPDTGRLSLIIGFGTVGLLGAAYVAMAFYDLPVRTYFRPAGKPDSGS